jgi:hypothetical protein
VVLHLVKSSFGGYNMHLFFRLSRIPKYNELFPIIRNRLVGLDSSAHFSIKRFLIMGCDVNPYGLGTSLHPCSIRSGYICRLEEANTTHGFKLLCNQLCTSCSHYKDGAMSCTFIVFLLVLKIPEYGTFHTKKLGTKVHAKLTEQMNFVYGQTAKFMASMPLKISNTLEELRTYLHISQCLRRRINHDGGTRISWQSTDVFEDGAALTHVR